DFAKLETELKVRLLPRLYDEDRAAREALGRHRRGQEKDGPAHPANRADRLEFLFAFEELLADQTADVLSRAQAEAPRPPRGRPGRGVERLGRLLGLLVRVRQEAALWLGFEAQPARDGAWRDELYFALAVYGLVNVRWAYEPTQREAALVSAGVAAARAD